MTGGGGAFRLEEYRSSIQQQQQQGEEDKEVDDGFSDDDHDDCTDFTFSSSGRLISLERDWEPEVRRRVALGWQAFGRLNKCLAQQATSLLEVEGIRPMCPVCTNVWVRDLGNYRYPVEKIGECPTQYGKKDPRIHFQWWQGELNEPTDVTQPSHVTQFFDDSHSCIQVEMTYIFTEDEFLQQQEVRRRLKVLNNEFTNRTVPAVHPTKPGQRRVTFSENLVQYSTNTDQVPTTEEAQDDGDRVEEYEELSDTELDSSIYSDFDWTEDLLDSIPDSEEEEEEEETEKIEAEEKIFKTVLSFKDELERMRLEEIDNETETDGDVDYTKTDNTPNSIQFNYDHDMPTSQSFQIDEDQKSVLVEKEGEFKLVGANDVHAEESSTSSSPNSSLSDAKVDPPIDPCHSNKQTTPKLRPRISSTSSKDSNSSNSKPKLPNYQGNPRSRYGISPKEIKIKREKEKYELRKKQKESEKQEEEKQQKEDEMEEAFKCWMMKKRQEKKEAKKKNKNYNFDDFLKRNNSLRKKSPEGMANGDSEEAFKVWLDKKKEQKKRENYVERKRREELEDAYHVPDRQTCEQAYKQLEKGVRQGDSISPKLFTVCLENVFRCLNWTSKGIPINGEGLTNLRFADDVVLFPESPQEFQLIVEELRTASSKVGLEINLSKTKVMFNRNVEIQPIMTGNVGPS
ncbi:putative uncharacterized transposon-derived protein F52C9.6 [Nymphon striatum]|nr:putative uncharacterized transposon-derived protein F52C9.6 [Nymphon striatum]